MRLFIALELPGEAKQEAISVRGKIARGVRQVKWVEDENLHLTLKFLGEVESERIEKIKQAMAMAVQGAKTMRLALGSIGFFPNRKQPRVIWMGLEDETDSALKLGRALDRELVPLGFVPDYQRKLHLTLGRIRSHDDLDALFLNLSQLGEVTATGFFKVKQLVLFHSELTRRGPIYTPVVKYNLKD